MAQLFSHSHSAIWESVELSADVYALRAEAPVPLKDPFPSESNQAVLLLKSRSNGSNHSWVLLTGEQNFAVRLNGRSLPLGLAVLHDKDEIRLGGDRRFYFSTEHMLAVEPFPDLIKESFCPRCKQPIEAGTPAVKCGSCGIWHHQSQDLPCFTYAQTCAVCDSQTALGAGLIWTPELL